jgi:MOSC domain-containing protein YiiM
VQRDFAVFPGDMGENITTRGVDLLGLPRGTVLEVGAAEVEITGLRNPCSQIDKFQRGLMAAVLDRDAEGRLIRQTGVMAVVRRGGEVRRNDTIVVRLPNGPHHPLEPV